MRLTKEQNQTIKQYIINAIDSEGYGVETKTDREKLQFLYDTFISEYGWNIKQTSSSRLSFKEWLQGLPSVFNIVFTNYDILELAKKWGSLPANPTEKQEDKIIENYWHFMATKAMDLINKI